MLCAKNFIAVLFYFVFANGFLPAQNENTAALKFDFIYNGQDLYFQNPLVNDTDFCITSVEINGITNTSEIQSSAFELLLTNYNFSFYDSVHLVVYHHADCKPKLLNPEELINGANLLKNVWVDSSGILHFITDSTFYYYKNEIVICEYRWNKWVKIGDAITVMPKKEREYKMDINKYLFDDAVWFCAIISSPHDGITGKKICYVSDYKKPPVVFDSQSQNSRIYFSSETLWQLYDHDGNFKMGGFGDTINYASLTEQNYFTLKYDNNINKSRQKFFRKYKINACKSNRYCLSESRSIRIYDFNRTGIFRLCIIRRNF
jgi:hypothetical protein